MAEETTDISRHRDVKVSVAITITAPQDAADDILASVLKKIAGRWDDDITPPDLPSSER